MSDFAKNFSKAFTGTVSSLATGMYKEFVRILAQEAPAEARKMLFYLVNEARARSGLPQRQTLQLLRLLHSVLTEVIEREDQSGPSI